MGFFDSILKGMGFDTAENGDDSFQSKKKPKEKKKESLFAKEKKEKVKEEVSRKFETGPRKSNFDLINSILPSYSGESDETEQNSGNGYSYTQEGVNINKNVIVYSPRNQEEVQNIIDFLRRKEPIIVNFEKFDDTLGPNMVMFLSGALYALKGSIFPISDGLYLLTPDGVNILTPRERE